jgi:lipoate---protein ligase
MKLCDLTLGSPEENLACDEVLLDLAEAGGLGPVLRFWEPPSYFAVIGYANQASVEVNRDFCLRHEIPVLRRCTGGGAILQGPGCLNYAVVLPIEAEGLQSIQGTNQHVLGRHLAAIQSLLHAPVERQGCTDLSIGGLKFSGNSQRRKKNFLLFHGSFLLKADIELIGKVLPQPSHQPEYRMNRNHSNFLMNLKIPATVLKNSLIKSWHAEGTLPNLPMDETARLAVEKYQQEAWNFKF